MVGIPRPVQFQPSRYPAADLRQIADVFTSGYGGLHNFRVQPSWILEPAALVEAAYECPSYGDGWDQEVRWSADATNFHVRGNGQAQTVPFNNKAVVDFGDKAGDLRIHAELSDAYTIFMVLSIHDDDMSGGVHSLLMEAIDEETGLSTIFWEWNAPPTGTNGVVLFSPNIGGGGGSQSLSGLLVPAIGGTPMLLVATFDGVATSRQYINDGTIRTEKIDHLNPPSNLSITSVYLGSRIYDRTRGLKGLIAMAGSFPAAFEAPEVQTLADVIRAPGLFNF